ncbi:hypothetical protein G5I_09666, partial [Acromyrmex echinatior]
GDTGAYRSRPGVSIASTFGRNSSGGSNLPSCRSSYSGVGSSSIRTVAKERALASFGGTFLKKDKFEEKPAFKYSYTSESSSTISRFGSTAGSRFLSSRSGNERMSTTVNYSAGGRFRNLNNKAINQKEEEEKEKLRFATKSDKDSQHELSKTTNRIEENEINNKLPNNEFVTLTVVTRGTSPTPPVSSSYVRNKRTESKVIQQNEVIKHRKLADTTDEEIQCDQMEEPSRFSRYGSSNRASGVPWSTYLDKYSSASSTGNPSIYSSRGYTNASSSSGRLNNFAYKKMNEASKNESSVKELSSLNQEIHNSDNKSQNEKFFSDLSCTTNDETLLASNDLKISNCQNIHNINKEDRIHDSERCCCGARKTETNGSSNNLRSSNNQNLAFYRREDSITKDSQDAKCDEYNKKKSSILRLKHTSPKNETKISKCSLKNEITSSKLNAYNERRGSTSKSDTNSSSREESLRIVEGHNQDQNEEVTSQKRNTSQRKDSTSRGSSQSRSASTSQTRNIPTKNIPRQMTRTGSSDGSSVNMPIGRSKSSSASSVTSQSIKIKTTTPPSPGKSSTGSILSSVNLRQGGSPDARGKPPVPKNDTTTAATPKCTVAAKYVNKDFRKSTLNMENGDLSCSTKYARRKKSQRNISVNAQDSEMTSDHIPQTVSSGSLTSMKSGQSRFRTPSAESKPILGRNSSNGSTKWEESKSGSKSPCGIKKRPSGTFSSSTSSQSTSVNSSSSEDDNDHTDKTGSRRRRKRTKSPTREVKGKISAGSSRTSVLASSADDMSMMTEKPPRPPSNPKSKSDRSVKTEEAKSFLMRALAPVTNFFKNKNQDSDDTNKSDGWIESFEENHEVNNKLGQPFSKSIGQNLSNDPSLTNSPKSDGLRGNNMKVQHQSSGEKPWWLDSNSDNVPEGVQRASPWNNDISQDTTVSTALPDDGKYKLKIWRQGSEEYAWWLDDVATEETKKSPVSSISRSRGSSRGSFRSADRRNRIRHQQSGERAWWMSDDPENVPEGIEVIPVASADSQSTDNPVVNESIYTSKPLKKIRHIESGEKAWWMDSSSNVPDGVVRIPVEIPNSTSDSSESYEKIDIGINPEPETYVKRSLSRFPIEFPPPPSEPLGDRASPEGVENPPDPPDNYGGRKSPYDNIQSTPRRLPPRKRPSTLPLFIGEHTDIDDVLGNTAMLCHSPVLSRVRKQECVEEDISEDSSECEEIDANQVIIHDGTLKTSMIQRRNRDNKRIQPDGYIPYLNDVDPFSYPTLYPDVNPPDHTFSATLPLINQLAAVHRLLRAPHRWLKRMVSKRDQDEKEGKEKKKIEGRAKTAGLGREEVSLFECNDLCDRPSDKGVTVLYFGSTELIFMNQRAKMLRESERNMTMRKDDGQVTIEINAVRGPFRK